MVPVGRPGLEDQQCRSRKSRLSASRCSPPASTTPSASPSTGPANSGPAARRGKSTGSTPRAKSRPWPRSAASPAAYAEPVGRLPDGLTLDEAGNLYVACYASDEIWRISPARQKTLLAWDHFAILLGRPTNLAWGGDNFDVLYVANLGRYTVTRAQLTGVRGQHLANQT